MTLSIVVDEKGDPHNVVLKKGLGFGLDEEAVKAAIRWRFNPGIKDDQPVRVNAYIEMNFDIKAKKV